LATLPWLKCSTTLKAPFLYLNLCLSVMLNSLSYSFTSICVLTAIYMPWWLLTMLHWLIDWYFGVLTPLSAIFQLIMATSFSGRGSRSTRREPPTMGKQLANLITCGCESSAPVL
jgi:hypothetical protein